MAHVALYRRFRPRRFSELVGQSHIVATLTSAVRDDAVGHAYLFSGPRGTGKTSTARILAKALNCTNLQDGEPCGECDACRSVDAGTSMDVHELDAASNRGIDDMKDLLRTVPLGTAGRTKVYVLDEVHMLTPAASAALLKTLEEPPEHVVFVLATTDPQKVLPTIRSRTQHLEFRLIGAALLDDHLRHVATEAGVEIDDTMIDQVIRRGGGSARDTLSALDQVIAGGSVSDPDVPIALLVDALAERDAAKVVTAVAEAADQGVDARELAEVFARYLRNVFLVSVSSVPRAFTDSQLDQLRADSSRLSAGVIVRAIESVGTALVDLRQANDPRLALEVALLGLVTDPASVAIDKLTARVDALEAQIAGGAPIPAATPAPTAPAPTAPTVPAPAPAPAPASPAPAPTGGPADQARAALAKKTGARSPAPAPPSAAPAPAPPPPPPRPGTAPPPDQADVVTPEPAPEPAPEPKPAAAGRPPAAAPAPAAPAPATPAGDIEAVWVDGVLASIGRKAKSMYEAASIEMTDDGRLLVALPNGPHMARCEPFRREVEAALASQLGRDVPVALMIAGEPAPPVEVLDPVPARPASSGAGEQMVEDEPVGPDELVDATDVHTDVVAQLQAAFPGSTLEEPPDDPIPGGDW